MAQLGTRAQLLVLATAFFVAGTVILIIWITSLTIKRALFKTGKEAQHHQYAKESIRKSLLNHNSNDYARDLECLR